jgi:polyribonucleotide 5'-hydroxyl-kinase
MQLQFSRYFYGTLHEYSPFTITLNLDEISIRKMGEDQLAPRSALPLGATRKLASSAGGVVIEPNAPLMLNSILAIPWASTEDELQDANVAGFIHVVDMNLPEEKTVPSKAKMTVLSVCPSEKLPSPFLILGSLKWTTS